MQTQLKTSLFIGVATLTCLCTVSIWKEKAVLYPTPSSPALGYKTINAEATFPVTDTLQKNTATILVFGDMMLDRNVRKNILTHDETYPFEPLKQFLIGSDIVVANAEGVFTHFPSETLDVLDAPLKFTFDPAILPRLKQLGFTMFSEANNHALNFGREGLNESETNITLAGLNYFGDPSNKDTHPYTATVKGQKIAFIGYNQFTDIGLDVVLDDIRTAKNNGAFIIIYPHWGDEYSATACQTQIDAAHYFIDAGADAVLGNHSHVIEQIEIYKGKAIFYSLGNFIFDQNFSVATSEGLSVRIFVAPTTATYYIFPLEIKHAQASLMSYQKSSETLDNLSRLSTTPENIKSDIRKGVFSLERD